MFRLMLTIPPGMSSTSVSPGPTVSDGKGYLFERVNGPGPLSYTTRPVTENFEDRHYYV